MATNSRVTPKHGRFRVARARAVAAHRIRARPRRGRSSPMPSREHSSLFGAVRGSGRTREACVAVAGADSRCHLAAVSRLFCGFLSATTDCALNAQSSCQRESRWRIMNADSDSLQSRACSPRARRRLSGANLHSPRLPALRALERARSQSPPSTSIHTRWLPCRPRASSRRAPRAHEPTRARLRKRASSPASRARARADASSRGASRRARLALGAAAAAQARARRGLEPRARRRGARGRGRRRRRRPRAARACRGVPRVPGGEGWGGRRGRRRTRHRPPGLRIPKTIKKISPSRAAKTASAGTRPSPRTCESRGGSRGETNGD